MSRNMRRIARRVLGAITGRRKENELAEEMDSHVRLLTEENLRRGLSAAEARRQAQLRFGGLESAKESYRDQRGLPAVETTVQDVRYAFRWMRSHPGFVAIAVLSLAIGIGANTAIFSLIHSVLLRPLAYSDPERLFSARELLSSFPGPMAVNPVHAKEWALRCPSIEDVAVVGRNRADLASGGEPLSTPTADVSHNTLRLFGAKPILGRRCQSRGNDFRVAMAHAFSRRPGNRGQGHPY
jgi:hypothetical protein